ncbi:Aste57867_8798 [Aphanomyces stellatus]|uniref:Aste57867_8798 protein n=1 Tax=Aphanomyces stellatus TaxID=120398 RepID=A0A485KL58_9STRA|nr:hypothetical protein As57867_008763 [Aphanomyces stellatus]VFT85684.1 Aste57867_8798 [Aphanomyces stellatus]
MVTSSSDIIAAFGSEKGKVVLQNGHAVAYVMAGSSNAPNSFVLIPGAPGSFRDFRFLVPGLVSDSFNVIAFDVPGCGLSSANAAGGPFMTNASAIDALVEALDEGPLATTTDGHPRRCFLVGHSFGGGSVLHIAPRLKHVALGGLALLAPSGFRHHKHARPVFVTQFIYWLLTWSIVTRVLATTILRFVFVQLSGFSNRLTNDEITTSTQRVATFDFGLAKQSAEVLAAKSTPVFLAYATNDPIIEQEIGQEIATVLRPSVKLVYSTGGHHPQRTHADEIAAALAKWAKEAVETK